MVLDMEGVRIDDPVRMYLREIGRVSLLNAGSGSGPRQAHGARHVPRQEIEGVAARLRLHPSRRGGVPRTLRSLVHHWPVLEEIYTAQYVEQAPKSRRKLMPSITPSRQRRPRRAARVGDAREAPA